MRKTFFLVMFMCCAGSVFSQQLTRFAVVDLTKVYSAFYLESEAVRRYEEQRTKIQSDIDNMAQEIQELRATRTAAVVAGDQERALRLENEINRKMNFLKEHHETSIAYLEEQRRRLSQSNDFLEQVHREIRFIAESEGYSMVLNLRESAGVLWHSPTVDITDKIIQNLLSRSRR